MFPSGGVSAQVSHPLLMELGCACHMTAVGFLEARAGIGPPAWSSNSPSSLLKCEDRSYNKEHTHKLLGQAMLPSQHFSKAMKANALLSMGHDLSAPKVTRNSETDI